MYNSKECFPCGGSLVISYKSEDTLMLMLLHPFYTSEIPWKTFHCNFAQWHQ